jgi:hypothetical protein
LICLENTPDNHSTYLIINLNLSKLFSEILKRGRKGVISILETRLLLRSLIYIPFLNDFESIQILKDLTNCFENHWYSRKDTWNCKSIITELKKLQKYVVLDYTLSGSIIIYDDDYIQWNLNMIPS